MALARTIVAVTIGYAIFAGSVFALFTLTGLQPNESASTGIMVGSIGYGVAAAMLAGYVAARLAPDRPLMHAAMVGGVIAVAALLSIVTAPPTAATWSKWAAVLIMAPAAMIGGTRSAE